LTSYGAFIELEEGLDGMIHVSDISWTRKINHPSEVFKKGDEVEAVVLEVDKANQRISVGIKQSRRSVEQHRPVLQGGRPGHRQRHQAGQLRRVRRLAARH
jgi:ribosomal protein S1